MSDNSTPFARMAAERQGIEPPEWARQPVPEVTTLRSSDRTANR